MRRVFFSFYHEGDKKRIGVVRNHGMCKPGIEAAGYIDAAEWEELKKQGDDAIEKWIDEQLKGTSITAVLIGEHTAERRWVNEEIFKSYEKGNALIGIYIHNIKGLDEKTTPKGPNPFDNFEFLKSGDSLASIVKTYDWKDDDGYNNFRHWIETAIASWKKPNDDLKKKKPPKPPVPGPVTPPRPPRRREVGSR
ncbi:MAG TPA: TIR domain-containing protein [Desulfosporosinus sp.]|nr:TIR domain-containing protein [Desulfosporosinus sp.]